MKNFLLICFASLSTAVAAGQQDSVLKITLFQKTQGEIKDFTTDILGNIYLLMLGNQVKKVGEKGDSIAVFNDVKRYGQIYSIDAINPLKVLVYYKDFATVVVLDRLLNVRNTIDLRKQNIFQVRAITSSYDNNIWLYDELDNKIKKIDDNGRTLVESTDLRQVFDSVPSPSVMFDRDRQLYLYDVKRGLYVFDYYGGSKNNYQILNYRDLQVIDKNTITARDSSHIILYKPATLQLFLFTALSKQDTYKKINFNGNRLYCLNEKGELEVYATDK